MISTEAVFGKTQDHLHAVDGRGCALHVDVVKPLQTLQAKAAKAGFNLQLASGFRSYERQLAIWNSKAGGHRPVYDDSGLPVAVSKLSDVEKVFAILRWSALPGASRHHWGSDLDIFDAAAVSATYKVQLTLEETCGKGPFAALHRWLDQCFAKGETGGFFRPYCQDRGGVSPEPWHLSYAPVASRYQRMLDVENLKTVISESEMLLKETVLNNLEDIFERFVWIPWTDYPPACRR